ncbi:hypothetical protein HDIA_1519 [Hartmannibacter diazotrophicus]|uniref:Uncharacterized protein n=1 Tax=Hartmannibacter diazotrophicus TaxID=1482074 RepID=A0A2C9D4B9_9HYPH|nr:hypothetical protein [Hartmannibacter diazotrophicus]SON55060.1 hypothetical protein HDIA_1519 [Hartmannibacter diazotrophicus]
MNLTKASIRQLDGPMPWVWAFVGLAAFAPVIYNGFPFVFHDTWNYVSRWDNLSRVYPPFYSFLAWTIGKLTSLYMVPVFQLGIGFYVIREFVGAFAASRNSALAALIAFAVVVLTQFAWLAGWLMPDVYAGIGAAAVMVLLLGEANMPARTWLILFLIACFSVVVSTANLLVMAAFAVTCLILRAFRGPPDRLRHYGTVAALVVLTMVGTLSANRLLYGHQALNDGGAALFFAKLTDAGIAQDYLHESCPQEPRPICAYLDELDRIHEWQGFLWNNAPDTLAMRTNAWVDPKGEFKGLNRQIVWNRWPQVLKLVAGDVFSLFKMTTLDTTGQGTGELVQLPQDDTVHTVIAKFYPGVVAEYETARQQTGKLTKFPAVFYEVSTYASYVLLLAMLVYSLVRANRQLGVICLAVFVVIALFVIVQGGLVGAYARYHVKISWLAWLCVLTSMARLVLEHRVSAGRPAAKEDQGMTSGSEAVR